MALIGNSALTLVRMGNGSVATVYAGRAVPEGYDQADAQRLLDEGYLIDADADAHGGVQIDVPGQTVEGLDTDDGAARSKLKASTDAAEAKNAKPAPPAAPAAAAPAATK